MKKNKSSLDRRGFLKKAAAGTAGATLAACASGSQKGAAPSSDRSFGVFGQEKDFNLHYGVGPDSKTSSRHPAMESEYDFIVVGAGAAGAVVASRLADNLAAKGVSGVSICVVEAGKDYQGNHTAEIPALHSASTEDPKISWEFFVKHNSDKDETKKYDKVKEAAFPGKTIKNPGRTDHPGSVFYPRAAAWGGCSSHNAMILMYPDRSDWETIAKIASSEERNPHARGWHPDRMIQIFETNIVNKWLQTEINQHDTGNFDQEIRNAIQKVLKESSIKAVKGRGAGIDAWKSVNEPSYIRDKAKQPDYLAHVPRTTKNGKRYGPRDLLAQSLARYKDPKQIKIDILSSKLVTQIILEKETQPGTDNKVRAVGIRYIDNEPGLYQADPASRSEVTKDPNYFEKKWEAKRSKQTPLKVKPGGEVILAGGVFNTPQLLLLSGIGGESHQAEYRRYVSLSKDGNVELPEPLSGVGKNLQDRYEIGIITTVGDKPVDYLARCAAKTVSPKTGKDSNQCFDDLDAVRDTGQHPKHVVALATNGLIGGIVKKTTIPEERSHKRANPDLFIFAVAGRFAGYFPGWTEHSKSATEMSWLLLKGHTRNKQGLVKLQAGKGSSSVNFNPLLVPDICFNSFQDQNSENDIDAIAEGVQTILEIKKAKNLKFVYPSEDRLTDAGKLKQFIRDEAWGHHASCSCPMGPKADPDAVLDSNFRVHGVSGLRVTDASVFPEIPGLFIVSSVYLIAERAAEVIALDKADQRKTEFHRQRNEMLARAVERAFSRIKSI